MRDALLASAAACSNPRAFEDAVLDLLARTVGFDAAFCAVPGATPTTRTIAPEELVFDPRDEPAMMRIKEAAFARRGVAIDTEVLGEAAVRKTSYHREIAARIGGRHSLLAYPVVRGRVVCGLMLGRAGSCFSSDDVRAVEDMLPALGVARASFGLPPPEELPLADVPSLRARLGLARDLERRRTHGVEVIVRDVGGERRMIAETDEASMIWSRVERDAPSESGWRYVDLFHLAAARAKRRERALFVGCGGGVALRQFARVYPGIEIDVVESSADVIDLARRWFSLGSIPNLSVHIADGRAFLAETRAQWDVIVIDAYDADALADDFTRRPLFASVRRALRPGGALAFNVVGSLAGPGPVADVLAAAQRELDDVCLVPVLDRGEAFSPHAIRNVVLVARTRA